MEGGAPSPGGLEPAGEEFRVVDGVADRQHESGSGATHSSKPTNALSRCVELATLPFVSLLHADDVLAQNWHATCLAALERARIPEEYVLTG